MFAVYVRLWVEMSRSLSSSAHLQQTRDERKSQDVVWDKSKEETLGICARGRNKKGWLYSGWRSLRRLLALQVKSKRELSIFRSLELDDDVAGDVSS